MSYPKISTYALLTFFCVLLTSCGVASSKGLHIAYDYRVQVDDQQASHKRFINLQTDKISITRDTENIPELVYDFKDEKIYQVYHDSKKYISAPLITIPLRFIYERNYRTRILKDFNANKVNQEKTKILDIDMNLGLPHPDIDYSKIHEKKSGKEYTVLNGDAVIAKYTVSDNVVPEDLEKSFERLFYTTFMFHPFIKSKILEKNLIPENIEYKSNYFGVQKTVSISLSDFKPQSSRVDIPDSYQNFFSPNQSLDLAIKKAIKSNSEQLSEKSLQSSVDKFKKEGKYGEALINSFFYHYYYCNSRSEANLSELVNKSNMKNSAFMGMMALVKKHEALGQGIEMIGQDQSKVVINMFVVDHLMKENKYREAEHILIDVLNYYPHMGCAFNLLGNLYSYQDRLMDATNSYEVMKILSPESLDSLSREIDFAKIKQDFYQYF